MAANFGPYPVSGGSKTIVFTDTANALVNTSVTVSPPQAKIIGLKNFAGLSPNVLTTGDLPLAWSFDETARTATLNDGGGTTPKAFSTKIVDLASTSGAVQFSMSLRAFENSSAGNFEATDSLKAELVLRDAGGAATTLNLVTPFDTDGNGFINGEEFNPEGVGAAGNVDHTFQLSAVIPDASATVQLVISGNNDSPTEFFVVQDLKFEAFANLRVAGVTPPAAGFLSGQNAGFSFVVRNDGSNPTPVSAWNDRVVLSTNTVHGDADDIELGIFPHSGSLAPGASYSASFSALLPAGVSGDFFLIVETDSGRAVAELQNEEDNVRVSPASFRIDLAPYADLVVENVVVAGPDPGGTYTVGWDSANRGTGGAAAWKERIVISSLTEGRDVLSVERDSTASLAVNAVRTQSLAFKPDGGGLFVVAVTIDSRDAVYEHNGVSHSAAEQNNIKGAGISASLDLVVTNPVVEPSSGIRSGGDVIVRWQTGVEGDLPVSAGFAERVVVRNLGTGGVVLDQLVPYDLAGPGAGVILAGGSRQRLVALRLPDGPAGSGDLEIRITTDAQASFREFFPERNAEANNTAVLPVSSALADYPDLVVSDLVVTPAAPQAGGSITIGWTDGNSGTAAAAGSWNDRVRVLNTTTGSVVLDTTVYYGVNLGAIPAGGGSLRSHTLALPEGTAGAGSLQVTVTVDAGDSVFEYNAAATSETNNASSASIVSILPPALSLSLGASLMEGATLSGQILLSRAMTSPLSVTLASSRPAQLDAGPSVAIPAGQTVVPFTITGLQDITIEPVTEVRITATASGVAGAQAVVSLIDDDWPTLTLSLDRTSVSEAAGANAAIVTVTRTPASSLPLTVSLANSLPASVSLPALATMAAGQASVSFPLSVVDNATVDGTRTAVLRAQLSLPGDGLISESPPVTLSIGDDEGAALELDYAAGYVAEGGSGIATLRRQRGGVAGPLTVTLSASPAGQLTLPATVEIPAGADQITFSINGVADGIADGSVPVLVSASGPGFSPAQARVLVTDLQLPDLLVLDATAPASLETEASFSVGYRVENRGSAPSSAPFVQRVLLSTDPVPGNDVILAQYQFSGILNPGVGFGRTEPVRAPRQAGTYWLLVTTDAASAVEELLETNNTVLFAQPVVVGASYSAVVQTAAGRVPANTPIVFTGSASRPDGSKVPSVLVNIHIRVDGTERIIAAITNSAGDFSTAWRPLPGEGGTTRSGQATPVWPRHRCRTLSPSSPLEKTSLPQVSVSMRPLQPASPARFQIRPPIR